jgi:hypothetical protein
MIYFGRGLKVYPIFNSLINKINSSNFCLSRISLEPRFKNILYKYNNIKPFNENILLKNDVKEFQDFKSNNISIKYDKYKYIITSKDSIVSASIYTALSILNFKVDDNKPIFLMDHFNSSDITYMKMLIEDFSSLKLYFNLSNDQQLIPIKVENIDDENIYIKKYCTQQQLEVSLEKINVKYDTYYTFVNNSVIYKDTLLRYYNIVDIEDPLYFKDKEYIFPKSIDVGNFLFLRP